MGSPSCMRYSTSCTWNAASSIPSASCCAVREKAIRHYLRENRSLLVKPVLFIILTSLIYSFANHFFHIEEQYVEHGAAGDGTAGKMLSWVQQN